MLAIAGVELRRFLRDRSNIFFVFVFPLLLVLVIGSQFGDDENEGRVGIVGERSELRSAITDRLEADGVAITIADAGDVREQVARGRADVGVFVPEQTAAAFAAGQDIDLEVILSTQARAPATLQRVRAAVRSVSVDQGQVRALTGMGLGEEPVTTALAAAEAAATSPSVNVVDVNDISREFSGVSGFDIGAAGQILLFVFIASLSGSVTLVQARRYGIMSRVLAAPVSSTHAVAGQALGRFAIALFQAVYIMAATALLFGVDWGNIWVALLVLTTFSMVAAGAAMLIGSVMDNDGAASGLGVGVGLVLAAMGGCMVPLEFFPDTLRTIANVTPHAWAYEAFAELQRHGAGFIDVLPELGVLVGMAVVVLVVGATALRRSLARAI